MGDTTEGSREGTQFGPYLLRRLVGRGGMGDVYEAEDTVRERVVALKLMSETLSLDPVFRARMQREARTAGRLQEPHVVPIHDYGEIDGQLYVDMRLIDGKDLAALLRRYGPLTPPRAVAVVRQIGSALDAAHAAGVTHRDVKPENILVSKDDFAYLVDFGIASAGTDEKLTQLGSTVGTLYYMAPERFGKSEVTYRADIYALACVLYECLVGTPPYRGDQLAVMGAHLSQPVPQPSVARPGIPLAFDEVIARGMAKDPADRYPTCSDLSAAAYAALATPDQDRASDILERSQAGQLPPSLPNQSFDGFAPRPGVQGSMWSTPASFAATPPGGPHPAPTGPPPAHWAGTHGWGSGPAGATGAPQWGQQSARPTGLLRKPWLWAGLAIAVIVAVVAGVIIGFSPRRSPTAQPSKSSAPAPAADAVTLNVLDDGVFVGSSAAVATIDVFNEPICPPCGAFVRSYAGDIDAAVANKKLGVRYHLLNFLDERSHTQNYSTRAVAASYCIAGQNDSKIYTNFYSALFGSDFQPQEGAASDRTDAELARLAQSVGANTDATNCIKSRMDLGTAQIKANNSSATLAGFNANGTPFVWDGTGGVDLQNPNWLTKLIG
ncbi:serine/threonine protein kinase PknE [Mycobacterium asiaticum]|uniref:non-specific serine/threonine protein kinase n=1 Tax=Mycobacterium asiaticum TaxID=1790 RepID=A0A1A3NCT8_MYCAS|nr:serine/threonine protein kinase PknE [Mycobacterium asiaticum]OBK18919.1 serine/threonine protein kinase [Mycobacterium asiaticum]